MKVSSSYEQKLMSAERAIKRLAKLLMQVDPENLGNWIIQGDKLGDCNAGDVLFVQEMLQGVIEAGIEEHEKAKPIPACIVCGSSTHKFDVRRHTRYCSDKCRQRAYRQRNGSRSKNGSNRNVDCRVE